MISTRSAPVRRVLTPAAAGAGPARAARRDAQPGPAVLAYHGFAVHADDPTTVRAATFDAHLAWLRDHGRPIVPLRDIVAWLTDPVATLPARAVAITVDEGHRSVHDILRPVVLRERFPVTLFVCPPALPDTLTWAELRALRNTGLFDVQSLSGWHPDFGAERRRGAPAAFRRFALAQFERARSEIARETGSDAAMLAWPFGRYDDELIALALSAGYTAGLALDARTLARTTRPLAIPRFPMVDACTPALLGRLLGGKPGGT